MVNGCPTGLIASALDMATQRWLGSQCTLEVSGIQCLRGGCALNFVAHWGCQSGHCALGSLQGHCAHAMAAHRRLGSHCALETPDRECPRGHCSLELVAHRGAFKATAHSGPLLGATGALELAAFRTLFEALVLG